MLSRSFIYKNWLQKLKLFRSFENTQNTFTITKIGRQLYNTESNGVPLISNNCNLNPIPTFQILNDDGEILNNKIKFEIDKDNVVKMYEKMVFLNVLDKILYESQRQGRISFYMTNTGEEASQIGSAAALDKSDLIYGQYREAGVLLWRGFSLPQLLDQCYGNEDDEGRGKQMPVHYGSKSLHFVTISSPLATQIPQAVGAAYGLKNSGSKNIVACYFGEGAASEGDAHAALNFSSTLDCPIIFFCRNNGFAISTPSHEQYKGDGIAGRAASYGISAIRCDGTDIFAVFSAMKSARDYVFSNKKPIIVEAMSYRVGHHSTSDDSSSYRSLTEVEKWNKEKNPITKMKNFMLKKQWWDEEKDSKFIQTSRKNILSQIGVSEKKLKPNWKELFHDVYSKVPNHLQSQMKEMENHIQKHKNSYPMKNFK